MRRTLLFSLAVLLLVTVALVEMKGQKQASDEAAIRRSWQDYVAAWNKHDTKLLAAFFTDVVDRRIQDGQVSKGRDASLAAIERGFGVVAKDATFIAYQLVSLQVDVRFLSQDVAILDARDELRTTPDTGRSVQTNHTSIFVRKNGRWLTAAIRAWPLTVQTAQPATR
jgi:uncharacterized protein (TIGR02246 family)